VRRLTCHSEGAAHDGTDGGEEVVEGRPVLVVPHRDRVQVVPGQREECEKAEEENLREGEEWEEVEKQMVRRGQGCQHSRYTEN